MTTCLHCGAKTDNGLALCQLCQRKAATDLEFIPVYFRNLARWRPGRAGSRPVPGSRVLYVGERTSGTGDRISDNLDTAMNALSTWARTLVDDRPHFPRPLTLPDAALLGELPDEHADEPAAVVALLCRAFHGHLTSLATLDWCGEFINEVGAMEARLRELTEEAVPGWYAGACRLCRVSTYVVPGLTWVTCAGCGSTTYARDHLETILAEARGWTAHPMRIAEAIVALVDSELSVPRLHDRIRQWSARGRIAAVRRVDADGDEVGPKRYRFGEVLDRLSAEGATRIEAERISA